VRLGEVRSLLASLDLPLDVNLSVAPSLTAFQFHFLNFVGVSAFVIVAHHMPSSEPLLVCAFIRREPRIGSV
jgi:hypothetical protein